MTSQSPKDATAIIASRQFNSNQGAAYDEGYNQRVGSLQEGIEACPYMWSTPKYRAFLLGVVDLLNGRPPALHVFVPQYGPVVTSREIDGSDSHMWSICYDAQQNMLGFTEVSEA